jgi:hypothetical protein
MTWLFYQLLLMLAKTTSLSLHLIKIVGKTIGVFLNSKPIMDVLYFSFLLVKSSLKNS